MKGRRHLLERRKKLTGIWLAAPSLFGTFLFFLLPFAICIRYSFTFGVGGAYFVGFLNYKDVFSSYAFQLAAVNTLRFLGIGVTLNIVLSFFTALVIKKGLAGSRLFRYILLLPLVLPIASVVMVVQVFFADAGILNQWLISIGAPIAQWLEGPNAFYVLLGLQRGTAAVRPECNPGGILPDSRHRRGRERTEACFHYFANDGPASFPGSSHGHCKRFQILPGSIPLRREAPP